MEGWLRSHNFSFISKYSFRLIIKTTAFIASGFPIRIFPSPSSFLPAKLFKCCSLFLLVALQTKTQQTLFSGFINVKTFFTMRFCIFANVQIKKAVCLVRFVRLPVYSLQPSSRPRSNLERWFSRIRGHHSFDLVSKYLFPTRYNNH